MLLRMTLFIYRLEHLCLHSSTVHTVIGSCYMLYETIFRLSISNSRKLQWGWDDGPVASMCIKTPPSMSLPSTPTPVPAASHSMARADPGTAVEAWWSRLTTATPHAPAFRHQPQRHPPCFCPPLRTPIPAPNHLMARADPGTAVELSLVVSTHYHHTMAPYFRHQPQRHPPCFCPPLRTPIPSPNHLMARADPGTAVELSLVVSNTTP